MDCDQLRGRSDDHNIIVLAGIRRYTSRNARNDGAGTSSQGTTKN